MMLGDKTAAGIDISQERISIVLLKQGKNGPELVKSVSVPMPQGAVKDGNIADPVLLAKTIRNLKFHNRIWTRRAAVSLFARPVVMQIIDMPQQVPTNIRQFVNNEVKNCVALPSRDITLDFCGIGSTKRAAGSTLRPDSGQADKRVLVVAAESARMVELVRVCSKGGFGAELVEPILLAYLRAIRGQKLTGTTKGNAIVAMLRGVDSALRLESEQASSPRVALALCVLRNGTVDFIRTKEMAQNPAGSDDLNCWLAEELSEVIRFYDIEVPGNTGKWEIDVFIDSAQSHQTTEKFLKSRIETSYLQVRTTEDAYMDTPVAGSVAEKERPSPVAVGLAMNLLMAQGDDVRINLLPPQISRAREAQRDVLIAVNAIAVVLLLIVLAVSGFTVMAEKMKRNADAKKLLITGRDTEVVLERHQQLDARIQVLSSRLDRLEKIRASRRDVNWTQVYDDIRKATPGSVRITSLFSQDGSRMLIEGLAMSNEAVNSFVSLLEKSQNISSVILLESHEQDGQSKIIVYQISCKLAVRSGKVDEVG